MKITPVIGNGLKFGIMCFLSYGNEQYLHGNHIPPPQTKQIENKKKKKADINALLKIEENPQNIKCYIAIRLCLYLIEGCYRNF